MIEHCTKYVVAFAALAFLYSCKPSSPPTDLASESLIPKPVSVVATGEAFLLDKEVIVYTKEGEGDMVSVAQRLVSQLNQATGFTNTISITGSTPREGIFISLDNTADWQNDEAYKLEITEELVSISASTPAGAFLAIQTLSQLIPFNPGKENYIIPTGTIEDYPLYAWRGAMLDVARHFFTVADVKRYIDLLSYYKINRLHLHLSDDQGWRIEIKSWPNLALHGGRTEVGGGEGGYYTQDEYKDIVAYAQSRFITIIPEIDLPGHINSALASYGELNGGTVVPKEGRVVSSANPILDGKNKPTELYTGIEVGWSTLRIEKEATFRFVNDVIREISEMTPGPFFHIGGDEAHVTKKEDYIQFINRFKEIVNANGKQMIGWEEIGQAEVNEGDIAQFWNSGDYAQMAADKGCKIIMSPAKKIYLDMKYDSTTSLGLNWAAYIEVDSAYRWDPATYAIGIDNENILGVEAPLWSETVTNMDEIEYLVFPRIICVAEVGWTPTASREWNDFASRLGRHGNRLSALGVDYYQSPKVKWVVER